MYVYLLVSLQSNYTFYFPYSFKEALPFSRLFFPFPLLFVFIISSSSSFVLPSLLHSLHSFQSHRFFPETLTHYPCLHYPCLLLYASLILFFILLDSSQPSTKPKKVFKNRIAAFGKCTQLPELGNLSTLMETFLAMKALSSNLVLPINFSN